MSKKLDIDFAGRLERAAKHAKVAYSQAAIGAFLGNVNRQTVDTWMHGSLPRADTLFAAADKFGVDARWFATGEGEMVVRRAPHQHKKQRPERRLAVPDRRIGVADRRHPTSGDSN